MAKPETLSRLNAIICDVLDDDALKISETTAAKDVPGWDSVNHITIIVNVERAFKIKFSTREVMSFKNVGEFAAAIETKIPA